MQAPCLHNSTQTDRQMERPGGDRQTEKQKGRCEKDDQIETDGDRGVRVAQVKAKMERLFIYIIQCTLNTVQCEKHEKF